MVTAAVIKLEPIKSSRIAAIGYDPESFTLAVRFPPTKSAPAGRVYHYAGVDEIMFDDLKNAESIGQFFHQHIVARTECHPFVCVDPGMVMYPDEPPSVQEAQEASACGALTIEEWGVQKPTPTWNRKQDVPDDPEGIKQFAMAARADATALTIETAKECEAASREVLKIRGQRNIALGKVEAIKEPATRAWKAACALYNEVDQRFAEAEAFLDEGILAYRQRERQRIAAETRAHIEADRRRLEEAAREQQAEYQRHLEAAQKEATQRARELAQQDAAAAEKAGASAELVEQIKSNPLPLAVDPVVPPPLVYTPAAPLIPKAEIPRVAGLRYKTEWFYTITDETAIPLTHEYYSLDPRKIRARVDTLKQHANIPGVSVGSREVPIKCINGKPGGVTTSGVRTRSD